MKRTPPSIAAELNVPTPNPAEDLGKVRMEADSLVLKTAVSSRLLVALVASLSVYLVGPYDSSTKLVVLGLPSPLQCAANWDGAWFTSLADEGYQYEQSHAFFPLMPLTMRVVANTVLLWLRPLVSSDAALLALSGAVVSNVCLIWSAGECWCCAPARLR
jgi:phosphatidylinositol glycan class V